MNGSRVIRVRTMIAMAALAMAVGACGPPPATTTSVTDPTEDPGVVAARTAVLNQLGENVAAPMFARLAESAEAMETSTKLLCDQGAAEMEDARGAWHSTFRTWMEVQALRSGPLEDLDLAASISYPIDPAKVDHNANEGVSDLGQVGSDARGLEAIGHVLYRADQPDEAACAYLSAMATRVVEAARAVSDEWDRIVAGGLSTNYATSQVGIEILVNDVIATVGEAARYLGDPPAAIPPQDAQGRDIADMQARLLGVEAVYSGAIDSEIGGDGLSRLVKLAFEPTDERMTERLLAANQLLGTEQPGSGQSQPTAADYLAAYDAVAAVHRTLTTEIASQLGATLMFGDADGDS